IESARPNIRTHAADEALRLVPPRQMSLEQVEITPANIRLHKREPGEKHFPTLKNTGGTVSTRR
ncbi:MAG: hypothetical protein QOD01_1345, partial [Actinomycetota bacterium]|nr:hypothetical protein [Actinomycetota bacterium]